MSVFLHNFEFCCRCHHDIKFVIICYYFMEREKFAQKLLLFLKEDILIYGVYPHGNIPKFKLGHSVYKSFLQLFHKIC